MLINGGEFYSLLFRFGYLQGSSFTASPQSIKHVLVETWKTRCWYNVRNCKAMFLDPKYVVVREK